MKLSWMRLRYYKRYPWLNRFTQFRRGAAGPAIRRIRPLLTSLYLRRIGSALRSIE